MLNRRLFLLTSTVTVSQSLSALDFDALPIKIRMRDGQELLQAMLTAMINEGYFRNAGLDVQIELYDELDILNSLDETSIFFGLVDLNAFILKSDKELPSSKAIFQFSDTLSAAIIGRKSRGVKGDLTSLYDKIIGAPIKDKPAAYFPLVLKKANIDETKIKIEPIGQALREPMLASGEVDAIIGSPALLIPALKAKNIPLDDLITLNYSDIGGSFYGFSLIAGNKTLKDHPEATKRFLGVIKKALNDFSQNNSAVATVLMRRIEGLSSELAREQIHYFISENIFTPFALKKGLGSFDLSRFVQLARLLQLKNNLDPKSFITEDYIP